MSIFSFHSLSVSDIGFPCMSIQTEVSLLRVTPTQISLSKAKDVRSLGSGAYKFAVLVQATHTFGEDGKKATNHFYPFQSLK